MALTIKHTFNGALAQVGTTRIDVTEYGAQLSVHGEKVSLTHDDLYRLGRFMVYMSIPSRDAIAKGKEDIMMLNPPKTPILQDGAVEKAIKENHVEPKVEVAIVKKFAEGVTEPVKHNSMPSEEMLRRMLGDTEELPILSDDVEEMEI